jgi:hypothetical protein
MSETQFGLGLLYIAVAVIWYAAGWWQGRTVERDRAGSAGASPTDTERQYYQAGPPGAK